MKLINQIKKSSIRFIRRLILKHKADSTSFIKHYRRLGCTIGDGTAVHDPSRTLIDSTRPHLINIGKNVQITRGVTILTHGYDWIVLKNVYGDILGSSGEVKIGDNVFIGMNTTILKGAIIGDNVIIGAGSVVNKEIPSNCVAAGSPAKFIMTLDDYYQKRKNESIVEAKELAKTYWNKYKKNPPISLFDEFFWLFLDRNEASLHQHGFNQMLKWGSNYETSKLDFLKSKPIYNGFEDFLENCNLKEVI